MPAAASRKSRAGRSPARRGPDLTGRWNMVGHGNCRPHDLSQRQPEAWNACWPSAFSHLVAAPVIPHSPTLGAASRSPGPLRGFSFARLPAAHAGPKIAFSCGCGPSRPSGPEKPWRPVAGAFPCPSLQRPGDLTALPELTRDGRRPNPNCLRRLRSRASSRSMKATTCG